eukprot:scaffold31_cov132-Skeletonema_menzelii.AAC.1
MDPDQVLYDDLELKYSGHVLAPVHMPGSLAAVDHSTLRRNGLVSSVFLASGLHATNHEGKLPRVEIGSTKARIKWFGALCVTGIGMFVEAFIIITTGQIKTVWHDAYPTCFVPDEEVVCPNLIQCCGLFPNTPDTCEGTNSNWCEPDGTYKDELLCNPGVMTFLFQDKIILPRSKLSSLRSLRKIYPTSFKAQFASLTSRSLQPTSSVSAPKLPRI